MRPRPNSPFLWFVLVLLLAGCSAEQPSEAPDEADGTPATPVTAVAVTVADAVEIERTVGRIEAEIAPVVDAEVPGTVARVPANIGDRVEKGQILAELDSTDLALALRRARAEVRRLEALAANQARTVERYRNLRRRETLSEGALEEAEAQLTALREQLDGARSQLATARRNLEKAIIRAPVPGRIQARHITQGDYVTVNAPLFRIASDERLRIHLPFPEGTAGRIKPGSSARLTSPVAPDVTVEHPVTSLRPVISGSRALEAVLLIDNPGGWIPGASVTAEVEVARREGALMVPEVSVVRRPAGTVVFAVGDDGTVSEIPVTTGVKRSALVEIRSGLQGDERVVTDGAGFLTDGVKVQAREPS